MKTAISEELIVLVNRQLSNLWGGDFDVAPYIDRALERVLICLSKSKNKYCKDTGKVVFSPYHSGQYSIFLYYLANTAFMLDNNTEIASRLYYLNKVMNAVDWYYEINLPSYFGVEHPLGSVLGRANYSNGLFVYQGCTVGGSRSFQDNTIVYPEIGKNLIMYSNTTVLGTSHIGDNVVLATGATVVNQDIPSNCIVFGASPNLVIKVRKREEMERYISYIWEI